mmetsp:Transcript_718/g.2738  ORF Transcript_718/g.2738 Transcript_718/m.2738 type:complete len:357 (-) Transcript_718:172-1242(-)
MRRGGRRGPVCGRHRRHPRAQDVHARHRSDGNPRPSGGQARARRGLRRSLPGAPQAEPRGFPPRLGRHHRLRRSHQARDPPRRLRRHPHRRRRLHRAPGGGHLRHRLEGQGCVHPNRRVHGHPALRVLLHRQVRPAPGGAADEDEVRGRGVPQSLRHELHRPPPVRLHAAPHQRLRRPGARGAAAVGHRRRHSHRLPRHPGRRQDDARGVQARRGDQQGHDARGAQELLRARGHRALREARRSAGQGEQGAGARAQGDAGAHEVLPVDGSRVGQAGVRGGTRVRGQVRRPDGGDLRDPGHGRLRDDEPGGVPGGVLLQDSQEAQGGGRPVQAEGLLPLIRLDQFSGLASKRAGRAG